MVALRWKLLENQTVRIRNFAVAFNPELWARALKPYIDPYLRTLRRMQKHSGSNVDLLNTDGGAISDT